MAGKPIVATAVLIAGLLIPPFASAAEPEFFKVNPRGTWLRVDPDDDEQFRPTSVALSRLGVTAGQFIAMRPRGAFKAGDGFNDDTSDMIAVFRRGNQRLSPGPKYPPVPVVTPPTCTEGGQPTDVPQDFDAESQTGWVVAQIPNDADNIAFSTPDCFFSDNTDPNQDYGVEITTFAEVMKNTVRFETSSEGFEVTFRPRFEMYLIDAAHLGGYDHFNFLQVITDLRVETDGSSLRLTKTRCGLTPTSASVCEALRDQNAKLPFPSTLSQLFFIIDPIYGGYKHQTETFGRPFPVRDSRPWFLDEAFGPEGETSGPTELQTHTFPKSLRLTFEPSLPPGLHNEWILSLAGVKEPRVGDLLLEKGTIAWSLPAPFDEDARLVRIAAIPKAVADRLKELGVTIRRVP